MKTEPFRMIAWLLAGLALYAASMAVGASFPQAQVALWKAGNATTFGWIGYWMARTAIGRVNDISREGDLLARAILMGAVVVAGALGL